MQVSTTDFTASDGATLCVYGWLPDPPIEPRAIVQIAHGMGEHAARYAYLATALCDAGFAVYAHDLRGHGRTAAGPEEYGDLGADGWSRCVRDLRELNDWLAARHPGRPRALLGHSMGASLAQGYALEHGPTLDALVFSAPSLGRARLAFAAGLCVARLERWRLGGRASSPVLHRLLFGGFNAQITSPRTEHDWISRDAAQVDAYVADPRCGFELRVQSQLEMFEAALAAHDQTRLRAIPPELPLYVFAGEADPVVGGPRAFRRLVERHRRAGLTRVAERVYPDARHETLNETNRDEVIADLIAWLEGALSPSPS